MRIEPIVATMFQENFFLSSKMNITGSCTIINQTDFGKYPNLKKINSELYFISNDERGLSRSRNAALKNSRADICLIADDDLEYVDGYEKIIENAYLELKDADVIIFDYIYVKNDFRIRKKLHSRVKKLKRIDALRVCSVRITFKVHSVKKNNITFNELFGTGSIFNSGEEHLFLKDCFENDLNVYYYPEVISKVNFENSSWFTSFNEKYFETKGAFGYAFFKRWYLIYILRFAIVNYMMFKKDISFFKAFRFMFRGKKKYQNIMKNKSNE